MTNTTQVGARAEALARSWLEVKGFVLLEANVRTRFFELDLVMQDGEAVVFVEVKYRASRAYGGGLGAITPDKQRRITVGALCWMADNNFLHTPVRFDVVEVIGDGPHDRILHFEDCFCSDDLQ